MTSDAQQTPMLAPITKRIAEVHLLSDPLMEITQRADSLISHQTGAKSLTDPCQMIELMPRMRHSKATHMAYICTPVFQEVSGEP